MNVFKFFSRITVLICFQLGSLYYGVCSDQGDEDSTLEQAYDSDLNFDPITEISLGCKTSLNPVYVYVSPTCLHCGRFLIEDVEKFLEKYGETACVVVGILPTSAKDIFIMKLIQNETNDANKYFAIFTNLIKRAIATINYVKPTDHQLNLYKGSNTDEEMIKFQVIASEFGFTDAQIISAIPNMGGLFEISVIGKYKTGVRVLADILETKELNLPIIVRGNKKYESLEKAMEDN
ncbi:MAG: hypothetical protein LBB34_00910 [Holosporales bacterium]|nr:hypothetical protein [Holosporales bacterium]